MSERRVMAKATYSGMSKRQKCRLLEVNLSGLYVQPKPVRQDNIRLMNALGDVYAEHPFKGYRKLTYDLRDLGFTINHKRVLRMMQCMGLQAVYSKKNLSKRRHDHAVYPYLMKDHPPLKPHDCWCVDITYIKIAKGFVYLTALIDVVSRHVMGWCLSPHLDTDACLEALRVSLKTGYCPNMINSDQGCQFTSEAWVKALKEVGIAISMDGKGRWADNIYIERFWRTIKYEEVYMKSYDSVVQARQSLENYIHWYNTKRRHQSLGYMTPHHVMTEKNKKDAGKRPGGYGDKPGGLPTNPQALQQQQPFLFHNQAARMR